MKVLSSVAVLLASITLVACSSNVAHDSQIKPVVKPVMVKKVVDPTCHSHSTNSATNSAQHCHKSSGPAHAHKYSK